MDKSKEISVENNEIAILCKNDIMELFKCENDKALRILRVLFQSGYGNKIGKEYYVSLKSLEKFLNNTSGKEVYI